MPNSAVVPGRCADPIHAGPGSPARRGRLSGHLQAEASRRRRLLSCLAGQPRYRRHAADHTSRSFSIVREPMPPASLAGPGGQMDLVARTTLCTGAAGRGHARRGHQRVARLARPLVERARPRSRAALPLALRDLRPVKVPIISMTRPPRRSSAPSALSRRELFAMTPTSFGLPMTRLPPDRCAETRSMR
jgi:hypothetical protein